MSILSKAIRRPSPRAAAVAATILAAGSTAVAVAFGSAAPAHADPVPLLAIVYSPATGAYGWANGTDSPQDLYNRAMQQCQNKGGTDCNLLDDAYQCAALAVQVGRHDRYKIGIGPDQIQANFQALLRQPGYILVSHCSTGNDGIG